MLTGTIFKPRVALPHLNHTRRVWAWVPAVLMIVAVMLTAYAGSHADSYYFYQDQLDFYAQNPERIDVFKHALLEKQAIKLIMDKSSIEEVEPELESPAEDDKAE